MSTEFTHDVFLSYHRDDKRRVRKIAEGLRDGGLRVWFDEWELTSGDDIAAAIERGLEGSRTLVLCIPFPAETIAESVFGK